MLTNSSRWTFKKRIGCLSKRYPYHRDFVACKRVWMNSDLNRFELWFVIMFYFKPVRAKGVLPYWLASRVFINIVSNKTRRGAQISTVNWFVQRPDREDDCDLDSYRSLQLIWNSLLTGLGGRVTVFRLCFFFAALLKVVSGEKCETLENQVEWCFISHILRLQRQPNSMLCSRSFYYACYFCFRCCCCRRIKAFAH